MEQFKNKLKKINQAIVENVLSTTSTILITIIKQIEARVEKIDWILSIFADTMRCVCWLSEFKRILCNKKPLKLFHLFFRLLNSNYFLMKIANFASYNLSFISSILVFSEFDNTQAILRLLVEKLFKEFSFFRAQCQELEDKNKFNNPTI